LYGRKCLRQNSFVIYEYSFVFFETEEFCP
jgi:hypothetical protein